MVVVIDVEPIRERFLTVAPFLDERGRRLVAAAIGRGLRELAQDEPSERIRRPGAGRKPTICKSLPSRKRGTRRYSQISRRWSNQRDAGIRNRRYGGPARAYAGWRRRCRRRATK